MSEPSDPGRPTSGAAEPPDDRTQRVRARRRDPASSLHVHDEAGGPTDAGALAEAEEPREPPRPVKAYQPTSTELAQRSRKERRRARDQQAERRAVQLLVAGFVGLGGLAMVAVNLWIDDPPPSVPPPVASEDPAAAPAPAPTPAPRPGGVISTPVVDTVDLPALRQLRNEGLTIAAEGLPAVNATEEGPGVAPRAALETCRFAYGVWEFSPNRRFRFLTTCPALDGQILFGAYAVHGGVVRMSPLEVGGVEIVSEFQVEKPSRLRSQVAAGPLQLSVDQRVTVLRAGLVGDAFFDTYAPKNTLTVPGIRAPRRAPAEPQPAPPARDPLLDLLKGK